MGKRMGQRGAKKMNILELTAVELGRKIKKREIGVMEATEAEIGRASCRERV